MKLRIVLLVLLTLAFALVDAAPAISYRPSPSVQAQQETYRRFGTMIPIDDVSVGDCQAAGDKP